MKEKCHKDIKKPNQNAAQKLPTKGELMIRGYELREMIDMCNHDLQQIR